MRGVSAASERRRNGITSLKRISFRSVHHNTNTGELRDLPILPVHRLARSEARGLSITHVVDAPLAFSTDVRRSIPRSRVIRDGGGPVGQNVMSLISGPIIMKFILGRKIEMSQVYRPDGTVIPVTLVQAGPCVVTQVKNQERDGYTAVQLGFAPRRKMNKPQAGHLKDLEQFGELREFRTSEAPSLQRGDTVEAKQFEAGDTVHVSGTSKGRGFQGVVKRYGFKGQKASHGHKDQLRAPGSIGPGGVQHVFKGTRMAGHMGDERVTVKNLEIVEVRNGVLAVKGAIPGARNSIVEIVSP